MSDTTISFTVPKSKIVELENGMVRVEVGLTIEEFLELVKPFTEDE